MTPTIAESETPLKPIGGDARVRSVAAPARFLAALERGPLVLDAAWGRGSAPAAWTSAGMTPASGTSSDPRTCSTSTSRRGGRQPRPLHQHLRRQPVLAGALGPSPRRGGHQSGGRRPGPAGGRTGGLRRRRHRPATADEPGAAGEQAAVLLDSGVDALVFETFELEAGGRGALGGPASMLGSPPVPLLASLWRWPDAVEDAARRLRGRRGRRDRAQLPAGRRRASCRWCGGWPRPSRARSWSSPGVAPGDPECDATPAAFAAAVPGLLEHNVRLIGGCCGTTEAHVAALAAACAAYRHPETDEPRGAAP